MPLTKHVDQLKNRLYKNTPDPNRSSNIIPYMIHYNKKGENFTIISTTNDFDLAKLCDELLSNPLPDEHFALGLATSHSFLRQPSSNGNLKRLLRFGNYTVLDPYWCGSFENQAENHKSLLKTAKILTNLFHTLDERNWPPQVRAMQTSSIGNIFIGDDFVEENFEKMITKYSKEYKDYHNDRKKTRAKSIPLTLSCHEFHRPGMKGEKISEYMVIWKDPKMSLDKLLLDLSVKKYDYQVLKNYRIFTGEAKALYEVEDLRRRQFSILGYDLYKLSLMSPTKDDPSLRPDYEKTQELFSEFKHSVKDRSYDDNSIKKGSTPSSFLAHQYYGATHPKHHHGEPNYQVISTEKIVNDKVSNYISRHFIPEFPVFEYDFGDVLAITNCTYSLESFSKDLYDSVISGDFGNISEDMFNEEHYIKKAIEENDKKICASLNSDLFKKSLIFSKKYMTANEKLDYYDQIATSLNFGENPIKRKVKTASYIIHKTHSKALGRDVNNMVVIIKDVHLGMKELSEDFTKAKAHKKPDQINSLHVDLPELYVNYDDEDLSPKYIASAFPSPHGNSSLYEP